MQVLERHGLVLLTDDDILPQARGTDKWLSSTPSVMSKLDFPESKLSRSALEHLLRETIV